MQAQCEQQQPTKVPRHEPIHDETNRAAVARVCSIDALLSGGSKPSSLETQTRQHLVTSPASGDLRLSHLAGVASETEACSSEQSRWERETEYALQCQTSPPSPSKITEAAGPKAWQRFMGRCCNSSKPVDSSRRDGFSMFRRKDRSWGDPEEVRVTLMDDVIEVSHASYPSS